LTNALIDQSPNTASDTQAYQLPSWATGIENDTRTQPWRAHAGIGEDTSFAEGKDLVRMEDAEYPGGSLAA
jgi:hypothetical protein